MYQYHVYIYIIHMYIWLCRDDFTFSSKTEALLSLFHEAVTATVFGFKALGDREHAPLLAAGATPFVPRLGAIFLCVGRLMASVIYAMGVFYWEEFRWSQKVMNKKMIALFCVGKSVRRGVMVECRGKKWTPSFIVSSRGRWARSRIRVVSARKLFETCLQLCILRRVYFRT